MSGERTKQLNVVPLGMEVTAVNMLEMALQGPGGNWCCLADELVADVAILEGDKVGALTLFDQHRRRFPKRPIIVLSVRAVNLKRAIPVRKPFKVSELMQALSKAQQALQNPEILDDKPPERTGSTPPEAVRVVERTVPTREKPVSARPRREVEKTAPKAARSERPKAEPHTTRGATQALEPELLHDLCGQAEDVNLHDPRAVQSIYYDPDGHLQGLLRLTLAAARKERAGVELQLFKRTIVLLPGFRQCYVPMGDRQLRALSVMPLTGDHDWRLLSLREQQDVLKQASPEHPPYALDVLLWKVALWSAHGRVAIDSRLDAPVVLKYWPNLTRLPLPPQALRILALWEQFPISLQDTAQGLRIPQRYVFALYSACSALGLVRLQPMAVQPQAQAQAPTKHRGLFQRIINVLRRS